MAGSIGRKGWEGGKGRKRKEEKRKERRPFFSTEPSQQESNQFNSISSKPCKKVSALSVENNHLYVDLFPSSSA